MLTTEEKNIQAVVFDINGKTVKDKVDRRIKLVRFIFPG